MPFELDTAQYKPPPKPKSKARKSKTKANGRGPSFDNCLAKVSAHMIQHPVFKILNASAIRVLLMCHIKHDNARYHNKRDGEGRHVWTFTYVDAKQYCDVSDKTFSKVLLQLSELGFLDFTVRGGLKGANGVKSMYTLSDDWKKWTTDSLKAHLEKQRSTGPVFGGL